MQIQASSGASFNIFQYIIELTQKYSDILNIELTTQQVQNLSSGFIVILGVLFLITVFFLVFIFMNSHKNTIIKTTQSEKTQSKKRVQELEHELKCTKEIHEEVLAETLDNSLDIKEAKEILLFINDIIREKFNHQMYSKLLPNYIANKSIDLATHKDIIDRIYTTVTITLTPGIRKKIKKYYTTKGIELLIKERVISLISEVDFNMGNSKNKKAIMDDFDSKSIQRLLK